MYIGSWDIDDLVTFTVATHSTTTGAATDADAVPAYRVYEDETGTPILTGNMAKLDDANTTGFYSEQITLSAANGFEQGKSYNIHISAAVGAVTGVTIRSLQVRAEVNANVTHYGGTAGTFASGVPAVNATQISGDSTAADNLESEYDGTGYGQVLVRTTIATLASQTGFTLTAGSADDNAYNGCIMVIQDASTAAQKAVAVISDYTGSTKTITLLNDPGIFTMATTDIVTIIADRSMKPTVDNRNVVVAAAGGVEVGTVIAAAANTIADALLKRDLTAVTGAASRSFHNAIRLLRNKVVIAAGTMTVYEEDDSTSAWTAAVSTTAGNPISTIDPT